MFKIVSIIVIFISLLYSNECKECHIKEYNKCKTSNHKTLKKAINITRNIWGINDSNVTLQTIPHSKKIIKEPKDLVDDFLRRKCLKCHLNIKKKNSCLACHEPHSTIKSCQKNKISNDKCLFCHNKGFVGGDYFGLFPKDHHKSFRTPLTKKGKFPPQKYGIDYHHLSKDIHLKKGMDCVDCHNNKNDKNWENEISCIDCHKDISKKNHKNYHKNLSCNTCHSAWNISSYELSVFRDDKADYKKWKNLTLQEDEYLTNFLNMALKSKKIIKPLMPDWVDKKLKKGIWYSGWRYKRWENLVLGNDNNNKVKILRPMFQYRVSYRDKNGKMVLDDETGFEAFVPYSPHTISKKAKSCEMCHENPLILNPTKRDGTVRDLAKPKHILNGTFLTKEQLEKLKSKKYKKARAKLLLPN